MGEAIAFIGLGVAIGAGGVSFIWWMTLQRLCPTCNQPMRNVRLFGRHAWRCDHCKPIFSLIDTARDTGAR